MAYAEWEITTITSTSGVVVYGRSGYLVELPACFPPIAYVMTTTPVAGENEGIWYSEVITTSIGSNSAVTTGFMTVFSGQKILAYQKGTRYLWVDTVLGSSKNSAASNTFSGARLRLYYRSTTEMYQTGA